MPECGSLLREAVFDAWETMNCDRRQSYNRPQYEAQVDAHYERHLMAVGPLQSHRRLAMTRVMAHVAEAMPIAMPYAATGPLELVLYLAWELALPLSSDNAVMSLVARWSEKPCCHATFTAVDVARARADWQRDLGEQAKRQLACAALARRRWRTTRDGLSVAQIAQLGSTPLSPRQFLAGDSGV